MITDRLSGKVALITGGGRGLGKAASRMLTEAGAMVISADIPRKSGRASGGQPAGQRPGGYGSPARRER